MEHIRNLFSGFTLAANWGVQNRGYQSPRGGFVRDQQKLKGDVARVGEDLKKTYSRYGKQVSKSRG